MTIVKLENSQYYEASYKGETWLGHSHSEALHRAMNALASRLNNN